MRKGDDCETTQNNTSNRLSMGSQPAREVEGSICLQCRNTATIGGTWTNCGARIIKPNAKSYPKGRRTVDKVEEIPSGFS